MGARGKLPMNSLPIEAPSTGAYKPSKEEEAERRKYRAKNALEDIERAEGHKRDSSLMKDVKQLAKEKVDCLKKIK